MAYETLTLDHAAEGVARLTLNRPKAGNAMNAKMCEELARATIELDEDRDLRALLLTASGEKMFCAGGDLKVMHDAGAGGGALVRHMTTGLHAAISRLARMRAPVVAAVRGFAAGGGFSLLCGCDLVIAGASSKFTMAYTRAGLSPDGSSTFFLAKIVGLRRAYELALTNRVLSAEEALDWGLVNRVVPDDEVLAISSDLAVELSRGPTAAFGATKRLLLDGTVSSLETQMESESRAIAQAITGGEGGEGMAAFLEKRPPRFG